MPDTTISKKAKNAKKCKEPQPKQELKVESFPIITTRGLIMKRNPIPDWQVKAMRIAMEQKWRPEVGAHWYHLQGMTYSNFPNWK